MYAHFINNNMKHYTYNYNKYINISIYSIICYLLSISSCGYWINNNNGFYCYKIAGGYLNLVLNIDWNISTDSSVGYSAITYFASTNNFTYNLNNLMLGESHRRIQKDTVIRDTNNIMVGGSSGRNTQNSSGTLNFNYNCHVVVICHWMVRYHQLENIVMYQYQV